MRFLFILFFTLANFLGLAQDTEKKAPSDFWERTYFGGNLELAFGSITVVNISPIMGYRFTDNTSAGIGPIYEYYSDNRYNYEVSANIYGARIFGRQLITKNIFAHAEFSEVIMKNKINTSVTSKVIDRLLIGGGYRERIGGNVYIEFILLYDVTHGHNSMYDSPMVYRGGIMVGL